MKTKLLTLALVVFSFAFESFGQISDSLYNSLPDILKPKQKKSITDQERQILLSGLSGDLIIKNKVEVYKIFDAADKQMQSSTDQSTKVKYAVALGDFYLNADNYPASLAYYQKAISFAGAEKNNFNRELSGAYANLAQLYTSKKQTDSSMYYLENALLIGDKKDSVFMCQIFAAYQVSYTSLNLYNEALEYAKKYIDMMPFVYKGSETYTSTLIEIADLYSQLFRKLKEKKYADTAAGYISRIMEEQKNEKQYWYGSCYFLLGRLHFWEGKFKEAVPYFDTALSNNYISQNVYDPRLGYLVKLHRTESLAKLGDPSGLQILDTLPIFKRDFNSHQQKNRILYEYAKQKGDWKNAMKYYELYNQYTDSIDLIASRGKMFETNQKYSVSQKEVQIQTLENKNLRQKQSVSRIITIAILSLVILLSFIALQYAANKKRETRRIKERQELLDELHSTEQEIELNTLQQQAEKEAAITTQRKTISQNMHDEVSSSLAALSYLIADIKKSTGAGGTIPVSVLSDLEEETKTIYKQARGFMHSLNKNNIAENYNVVELLQNLSQRFNETKGLKINIQLDVEEINAAFTQLQHTEMYRVMKEAVANSIKHSGASVINIKLFRRDESFFFEIADNGKGISENSNQGMGIAAIRQRIETLKGKMHITTGDSGTFISGSFPVTDMI